MDLLPYFPDEVMELNRIKVEKGMTYRLARCSNPYPDHFGKKVEIVKN